MNLIDSKSKTTDQRSPDPSPSVAIEKVSRRGFLKTTAGLGASGLLLGFAPECAYAIAPGAARDESSGAFAPNVYIQIGEDGTIGLIIHRSEMGQGVRTSLAMMLAEELEVELARVELIQAPGDKKYGDQNTDGSFSIRINWEPLRRAGAAAREMLTGAAARKWGVSAADCYANNGSVHHRGSGRSIDYADLANAAAELTVPENPQVKDPSEFKIIGQKIPGVDLADMLQGKAKFGADITLPGMVYASIERAPTVKGTIKSIDSSKARAVKGVREIFEMPWSGPPVNTTAGVAVVADTTWAAIKARRELEIEWDDGDAKENSDDYRRELETLVRGEGKVIREEGDFAKAKAEAAEVLTAEYHGPYLVHAPMEPLTATVLVKDGKCEVWAPTQDPQPVRSRVAQAIGFTWPDRSN